MTFLPIYWMCVLKMLCGGFFNMPGLDFLIERVVVWQCHFSNLAFVALQLPDFVRLVGEGATSTRRRRWIWKFAGQGRGSGSSPAREADLEVAGDGGRARWGGRLCWRRGVGAQRRCGRRSMGRESADQNWTAARGQAAALVVGVGGADRWGKTGPCFRDFDQALHT